MANRHSAPADRPMVVTAWIDPEDLELFNRLRRSLFPAERNYLSAHVTLFHHIPSPVRQDFIDACRQEAEHLPPLTLAVGEPFSLGKGVAFPVSHPRLSAFRAALRSRFADHLTAQDDRPWKRPHITVQNKVDPPTARETLERLRERALPPDLRVRGIACHRYDGGPWTLLREIPFCG